MSIRISLLALASVLLITAMASLSATGHANATHRVIESVGVH